MSTGVEHCVTSEQTLLPSGRPEFVHDVVLLDGGFIFFRSGAEA